MIDVNIKTVLLGSSNVGKTSLVRRFVENKFIDSIEFTSTIGGAFISKEVFSTNERRVLLCIWDTAGEEKYESITRSFYRNANAAIVCFDVTSGKSWNRAKRWVSELRQFEENCVIYLCTTKLDLIRERSVTKEVSDETISAFISEVQIRRHFKTSSKSGENVGDMFLTIARDFMELNSNTIFQNDNVPIRNDPANRACCFGF